MCVGVPTPIILDDICLQLSCLISVKCKCDDTVGIDDRAGDTCGPGRGRQQRSLHCNGVSAGTLGHVLCPRSPLPPLSSVPHGSARRSSVSQRGENNIDLHSLTCFLPDGSTFFPTSELCRRDPQQAAPCPHPLDCRKTERGKGPKVLTVQLTSKPLQEIRSDNEHIERTAGNMVSLLSWVIPSVTDTSYLRWERYRAADDDLLTSYEAQTANENILFR